MKINALNKTYSAQQTLYVICINRRLKNDTFYNLRRNYDSLDSRRNNKMSERGSNLELKIDQWIKKLLDKGIYGQKNHAKRLHDGTFVSGEAFDYLIICKGKTYCFDAKESKTEKWSLQNAKLNQIKYLKISENNGAESFFLVYFYGSNQLIRFNIDVIINALTLKQRTLTADKGVPFDYVSYQ